MTKIVPIERIANKIYLMRSAKVMLDRDLAELYGVDTKVLKQAVRRNFERFPADFMFELTKEENQSLRSQNVTLYATSANARTAAGQLFEWLKMKNNRNQVSGADLTPVLKGLH